MHKNLSYGQTKNEDQYRDTSLEIEKKMKILILLKRIVNYYCNYSEKEIKTVITESYTMILLYSYSISIYYFNIIAI
jgi:hypothetical protein